MRKTQSKTRPKARLSPTIRDTIESPLLRLFRITQMSRRDSIGLKMRRIYWFIKTPFWSEEAAIGLLLIKTFSRFALKAASSRSKKSPKWIWRRFNSSAETTSPKYSKSPLVYTRVLSSSQESHEQIPSQGRPISL